MLPPDQRLFEEDVQSAPYRIGVAKGLWAQAEADTLPDGAAWPKAYLWMAAAPERCARSLLCRAEPVGLQVGGADRGVLGPGEEGAARNREMAEGQAGKPVRDGVPNRPDLMDAAAPSITLTTASPRKAIPNGRSSSLI